MNTKFQLLTALMLCCTICFGQKSELDQINFSKSAVANADKIKVIETSMKYVTQSAYKLVDKTISAGGFYISSIETTNLIYNAFLKDLQDNNLNDLYQKCKIDFEGWTRISEAFENTAKTYHNDAKWNNYPVVNISKEAADLFCLWFTKLYNKFSGAKYNHAEFRLPSENEWIVAASGGIENAMYPWEGKFLRNKKGEICANFRIAGEENIRLDKEGKIEILDNNVLYQSALEPVTTYTPNRYGLYQISGNAAEMTSDGKVKGGSWHSFGYYMQISADDEPGVDQLPNAFTGFRIVMIVR